MKKSLVLILLCMTLLVTSHANEKVFAADLIQNNNSIETVLNKLNPMEIKSTFNIYNWTTTRVNMRVSSSIESDIICTLEKREEVEVLYTYVQWIQVKYQNQIGFIYSEYLTDNKSSIPDNKWNIELNDNEIEMLAKIVWLEARNQSDSGEAAVVSVILNRMLSDEFSNTILKVLSDTNQFATWKLLSTANLEERELEIVEEVLHGEWDNLLSKDYLYFSTSPRNNNGTVRIEDHYFCK